MMVSYPVVPARWRCAKLVLPLLAAAAFLTNCSGVPEEADPASDIADRVAREMAAAVQVDTVGVLSLTEGDTLNMDEDLTIIEKTRVFPPEAEGGEAFAWEFYAESHRPVKLLIFRWAGNGETKLELVGEGPMVVPRELGINRVTLPEPIPVGFRYLMGIYQPEAGTVPFKKVQNWKTLITQGTFGRPYTERSGFVTYGWRYAFRVLWRKRA